MIEPEDSGEFYRALPAPLTPREPAEKLRIRDDIRDGAAYLGRDPNQEVEKLWALLSLVLGVTDAILSVMVWWFVIFGTGASILVFSWPCFCCAHPLMPFVGLFCGSWGLSGNPRTHAQAVWGMRLSAANVLSLMATWMYGMYSARGH